MDNQRLKFKDQIGTREKLRSGFEELYRQLNEGQRRAVDAIEGPVMVLAGPGTGKTQVLTMRIANILRRTDTDPGNILCLTFTESAAAAMRERLISIIGKAAYRVRICTFHSFCNDLIQSNPAKFALAQEWQAISEVERVEVIRDLIDGLPGTSALKPFGSPYLFLPDIRGNLQWLKKERVGVKDLADLIKGSERFVGEVGKDLDSFISLKTGDRTESVCEELISHLSELQDRSHAGGGAWAMVNEIVGKYRMAVKGVDSKREWGKARTVFKNDLRKLIDGIRKQAPRQRDLVTVYRGYQEKLVELGRYDFEDMIMQVLVALRSDRELLAEQQETWQYILVDEYQDTNGAQNEVVRLLSSWDDNPNVFVVGDDKQSIFRFQGASLENLLTFYNRHQGRVEVMSLQDNYRSAQLILDAAGKVIDNNKELVGRYIPGMVASLVSANSQLKGEINLTEYLHESQEAYETAVKIKGLVESGVAPGDIAVLYRFNRDAEELVDNLWRLAVPVRLAAGQDVLSELRVRQLMQLLVYLTDQTDDDALVDILNFDWWGFKPVDVLRVVHWAGKNRESVWSVMADRRKLTKIGVSQGKLWLDWVDKMAYWRAGLVNKPLIQGLDELVQQSGLLKTIVGGQDRLSALRAISALYVELKKINQADRSLTAAEFNRRLRLMKENGISLLADSWAAGADAVRLMTAHKAKGLEFEHVFVVKLTDKHWGNLRDRTRVALPAGIVRFDPVAGQENNEDERRLFYVALTRAKKCVHLSYSKLNGEGREQVVSEFSAEIPGELVGQHKVREESREEEGRLILERSASLMARADSDVRDWVNERLKDYVMSVTHLNHYLECPRLFYYRNLLRVPATKTKYMALGTAVHGALYDLFGLINRGDQVVTKKFLLNRFRWYIKREILSERDLSDSLAVGEQILSNYYQQRSGGFVAKSELEYSFRGHGVVIDDLPMTGQLDKIELLDGNKVNVVDYKTGNPDNAGKHSRVGGKYHRQLVFYKLMCDESKVFKHDMVSGELDFVQPSKRTGKLMQKKYEISDDEVGELKEMIRQVWEEIKQLKFLEDDAGCGECEYCRWQ